MRKRCTPAYATVEEVDKEALANYDDHALLDVGCERTKPKDKFWLECKKEELKRKTAGEAPALAPPADWQPERKGNRLPPYENEF